ncbi:DUF4886 domain-containing protein, partial [Bacteroidales bacterium OttesenSCG-928-I21]|nr:DUF4886 domain-containing protein [Bacteroidales bacterium OttesenSCG-928-I21]
NGRTSYIGDKFCRDGFHLDRTIGRYTAACTWYEKLTGKSVLGNPYVPSGLSQFKIDILQHAAHYAVETPERVTDMYEEFGLKPETFILAAPLQIDFGTSKSGSSWNNVTSPAVYSYTMELLDSKENETPLKIAITEAFNSSSKSGPSSGMAIKDLIFPKKATSDMFFGNAGNTYKNKKISRSTIVISNLNPNMEYDFKMISSCAGVTDNRETAFTVEGTISQTAYVNSSSNTTEVAAAKFIKPKADGTVKISITAGPNNNNEYKYFYINALTVSPSRYIIPSEKHEIFIDFGPIASATINPVDGKYWNNIVNAGVSARSINLINSQSEDTPYDLQIIKKFSLGSTTGLKNPDSNLLGELAVVNATNDYFFVDGNSSTMGAIKLKNLDKNKGYKFQIFASRSGITQERTGLFTFHGETISTITSPASGVDLGGTGINQNTDIVSITDCIVPDDNGEILIEITKEAGSYAHLNLMKIEECDGEVDRLDFPVKQTLYVDFGRRQTQITDINQNYWNNVTSGDARTTIDMKNSKHISVPYKLEITQNFIVNDSPGGLNFPKEDLLKEFAIGTVTNDYFYVKGTSGIITLKNLNPEYAYKFQLFASRSSITSRYTNYKLTGNYWMNSENAYSGNYQTSGPNIGGSGVHANSSSFFISDFIFPDANGEIKLEVSRASGSYGYLSAMKVEEYILPEDYSQIYGSKAVSQPVQLYISGNDWDEMLPMSTLTDSDGNDANIYEVILFTSPNSFKFYSSQDAEQAIVYGGSDGQIIKDGGSIDIPESGFVKITVNLNDNTYTILPMEMEFLETPIP